MASASFQCDGCFQQIPHSSFCATCEQLFCPDCTRFHMKSKATRLHILVDTSNQGRDFTECKNLNCGNNCRELALSLCLGCKQILCTSCNQRHSKLKATKDHVYIAIQTICTGDAISESFDSGSTDNASKGKLSKISPNQNSTQVEGDSGPFEGTLVKDFISAAPRDTEVTRVRGLVLLRDGKCVVADYKNRSLKLFSTAGNFEMSKDLKEDPRGIAITANDFIAVTIADKKEIKIFRVENNKIRSHKTFKLKEKPYSITCNMETFAVETGEGEDGAIRIYNTSGKELHVLPGYTRSFGQFTGNTIRLAYDHSSSTIFVADVVKEAIHSVNSKNDVIWTRHLKSPRGAVLFQKVLFVASIDDNKIYQMNASNGLIYNLLDVVYGISRPRYITFQPSLNLLAVESDGNQIKTYKLMPVSSTL